MKNTAHELRTGSAAIMFFTVLSGFSAVATTILPFVINV
jgi:hypothetical protein